MSYLPIDLMTSELRAFRRLKVETSDAGELLKLNAKVDGLQSLFKSVNENLELLNAKFEEAFNTGITKEDLA
jgi:hypothetical protein